MKHYLAFGCFAFSALLASPYHSPLARGASEPDEVRQPPAARNPGGWPAERGTASYYGPAQHGRKTASGLRFDQRELTAAHSWLPFGTRVKVILGGGERSVIVTVTDRLYSSHRIVDLSVAAARQLGIIRRGIAEVTLVPA